MDARVRLGQLSAGIVVALLVMTAAPLTVAGGGPPADVGDYVRDGTVADLTREHIQTGPGSVVVDAPTGSSEVRVDTAYVQDSLGDFAADHPFTIASGSVVVESDEVTFTTFAPGADEVFTLGSDASLRFFDRPMWVSVLPIENGVEISVHDGDSTGQDIRFDKDWLAGYEVRNPIAVHEDGTVLDISATVDESAFVVHVPHFSGIKILNPDLDQSWMTEDFTFYYHANGPTVSFDFQVTVVDTTADEVTFRFWRTIEGVTDVFDERVFDSTNRESVTHPGYFSYNFVNELNLGNGEATLGLDLDDLTLVTTNSYVFTGGGSGNLTYYYDLDQGWLRKITDSGNGAEIAIYAWGTGAAGIPTDGPTQDVGIALLTTAHGATTPVCDTTGWTGANAMACYTGNNARIGHPIDWSGGESDESAQSDILSEQTRVTAKVDYFFYARAKNSCDGDDDCAAHGGGEFCVHWPSWDSQQSGQCGSETRPRNIRSGWARCPGASHTNTPCESPSDVDWQHVWEPGTGEAFKFTAAATIDTGLLSERHRDFALCMSAFVSQPWSDKVMLVSSSNCADHVYVGSSVKGTITVEACPICPV